MPPSPVLLSARDRLLDELTEELETLEDQGLLRRLTSLEAVDGPRVWVDGREVVNWCSNDFLGLSLHPALAEVAARAAAEWGIGARASRLLAGTTAWHLRLEESLAAWFSAEAAIVYPSGYLTNLGTLGALLASQDAVFIDRLAHASLFDAARASRATLRVFRHNDTAHLAALLSRAPKARRRFIITEGVFSMDGDCSPLEELLDIAQTHHALVYVDDAHGAFILGKTGRGAPEAAGVPHDQLLYMGTLGKALGCQGGFVVGPRSLIDFLRNRARTFIYTTALAVPVAAAAVEALRLVKEEPHRRERLRQLTERLHERLAPLQPRPMSPGFVRGGGMSPPLGGRSRSPGLAGGAPPDARARTLPSHIVPFVVGEARRALDLAQALWEQGIWAPAIRPPTVPEGTARLRLNVTALHTEAQIDALVRALQELQSIVHSP